MIGLPDKPEMTLWAGFKLETFSGVITYRVSQTNRLVIMTTNRRAGNPGTPDGGTNQICNIGDNVVNDIKTNLTALNLKRE